MAKPATQKVTLVFHEDCLFIFRLIVKQHFIQHYFSYYETELLSKYCDKLKYLKIIKELLSKLFFKSLNI
jgi:hypothetical protein